MIAIIDYSAGNLHSVKNALDYCHAPCVISNDKDEIMAADRVILPGVGAFGDAMASLKKEGLVNVIGDFIATGKPFLGICLGLQLLFESSEESPGVTGLGLLPGKVLRLPDRGLKIPHIGWNDLSLHKTDGIFRGIGSNPYMYFVHSYYLQAEDFSIVSATAQYGTEIHAAVAKNNLYATQFHPEKSGDVGLRILKNFTTI